MEDEIRDIYYAYAEILSKKFWGFELGSINELFEDEKYISWPIYFFLLRILKIPTSLKLKIDKQTNPPSPILPPSREFDKVKSAILLNPDNISAIFSGFLKSPLDKSEFKITSPLDVHRYLHETFKVFLSSKYNTIAFKNNPNLDNERKIRKRVSEIKTTILDKFDTKIITFEGRELIDRPSIADYLALMDLANVRMLYGAYLENSSEKTSPNQAIMIALKIYEALLDNIYYPFYQLKVISMEDLNKLNLATSDELSPEYVDFLIDEQNDFLDIKTSLPKHKKIISALSGFSYYLYFIDIFNSLHNSSAQIINPLKSATYYLETAEQKKKEAKIQKGENQKNLLAEASSYYYISSEIYMQNEVILDSHITKASSRCIAASIEDNDNSAINLLDQAISEINKAVEIIAEKGDARERLKGKLFVYLAKKNIRRASIETDKTIQNTLLSETIDYFINAAKIFEKFEGENNEHDAICKGCACLYKGFMFFRKGIESGLCDCFYESSKMFEKSKEYYSKAKSDLGIVILEKINSISNLLIEFIDQHEDRIENSKTIKITELIMMYGKISDLMEDISTIGMKKLYQVYIAEEVMNKIDKERKSMQEFFRSRSGRNIEEFIIAQGPTQIGGVGNFQNVNKKSPVITTFGDKSNVNIESDNQSVNIIGDMMTNLKTLIERDYMKEDKYELIETVDQMKHACNDPSKRNWLKEKLAWILTKTSEVSSISSLIITLLGYLK